MPWSGRHGCEKYPGKTVEATTLALFACNTWDHHDIQYACRLAPLQTPPHRRHRPKACAETPLGEIKSPRPVPERWMERRYHECVYVWDYTLAHVVDNRIIAGKLAGDEGSHRFSNWSLCPRTYSSSQGLSRSAFTLAACLLACLLLEIIMTGSSRSISPHVSRHLLSTQYIVCPVIIAIADMRGAGTRACIHACMHQIFPAV